MVWLSDDQVVHDALVAGFVRTDTDGHARVRHAGFRGSTWCSTLESADGSTVRSMIGDTPFTRVGVPSSSAASRSRIVVDRFIESYRIS